MTVLMISILLGGGLGASLGWFAQCRSGSCPLTANWKRGALFGVVLGVLFYYASGNTLQPYTAPKNIAPVADSLFDTEVLHAGKPVVVDFFAKWCGPCKSLSPRLDRLAGEFGGKVKFVCVNVDESPNLAARYEVQMIPTVLFFDDSGKLIGRTMGAVSEAELRGKILALGVKRKA